MRLIDADALVSNGWHLVKTGESNRFLASMSLADVPIVDAAPVVHGHWIDCSNGWMCSICERDNTYDKPYCPNCGAKMDGERRNGDG